MRNAIGYVRYTPDNDRESGFPHKNRHVCFGPLDEILSLANVLNPSALQRREELLHRLQLAPYRGD